MERFNRRMKAKTENMVNAGNKYLEAKLMATQGELETRLEGQLAWQGERLDDMEDRWAKSEETLARSEERLKQVNEEVRSV